MYITTCMCNYVCLCIIYTYIYKYINIYIYVYTYTYVRRQPRRLSFQEGIAAGHAGSQEGGLLPGVEAGCQPVLPPRHVAPPRAAPGREAERHHLAGGQRGQGELEALGQRDSLAAVAQESA